MTALSTRGTGGRDADCWRGGPIAPTRPRSERRVPRPRLEPSGARRRSSSARPAGAAERAVDVNHIDLAPTATADTYGGATGNTGSGRRVGARQRRRRGRERSELTASRPRRRRAARRSRWPRRHVHYVPPVGFTGDDSFRTLHDTTPPPRATTGTVTVHVARADHLVRRRLGAGRRRRPLGSPFARSPRSTPAATADGLDSAGDRILLAASAAPYTEGIVLEAGQKLLGDRRPIPSLSTTGAPAVRLADGADVHASTCAPPPPRCLRQRRQHRDGRPPSTSAAPRRVALDGGAGAITIGSPSRPRPATRSRSATARAAPCPSPGPSSDSGAGIELRTTPAPTWQLHAIGSPPVVHGDGRRHRQCGWPRQRVSVRHRLRDTTIGTVGVHFQSVSANTIVLNATGPLRRPARHRRHRRPGLADQHEQGLTERRARRGHHRLGRPRIHVDPAAP